MGNSRFSDVTYANYEHRVRSRLADPVLRSSTAYTADVNAGRAERKVHQMLDPRGVTARESRDSEANPNSLAIAVFFDVTGSMGGIPVVLQRKLKTLMQTLTTRGYVADPQVMFGAIGDATCDGAPLQVGQFESDIQMDEDLSRMWLEGSGGAFGMESYELAYYFAARHTATDCWERRRQKGYLFTIGDEAPYPQVNVAQVQRLIGGTPQGLVTTEAIIREAGERYHCFHLFANPGRRWGTGREEAAWRALLGDRVIRMEDEEASAELVALVIGLSEGAVDVAVGAQHLREMGVAEPSIATIAAAVETFARAITVRA